MPQKNAYLAKQEQIRKRFLQAGMDTAWQEFWDLLCIVLHDPEVMGKDTFGKERLMKIRAAIAVLEDKFCPAMTTHPEADYYQEKMDALLRDIFGDDLAPFKDRYPYVQQFDYSKGKKEWR
jgi:hypothetical protein